MLLYDGLSEMVKYFKEFDESGLPVDGSEIETLKEEIKNNKLDIELRPLKNSLDQIIEHEKNVKKSFFCNVCDY